MQEIFITGAAGFIGSNLVDRLLADGKTVVGWDNFSTDQKKFLDDALKNPKFKLVEGDNLDLPALTKAMAGCDTVFHLAANADVRFGLEHEHPSKDLQQNTGSHVNLANLPRHSKRLACRRYNAEQGVCLPQCFCGRRRERWRRIFCYFARAIFGVRVGQNDFNLFARIILARDGRQNIVQQCLGVGVGMMKLTRGSSVDSSVWNGTAQV